MKYIPQKKCLQCKNVFRKTPTESKISWKLRHKYCSVECKNKSPRSIETRLRQSKARLGRSPWNKGVKYDEVHRMALRVKHKPLSEITKLKMRGRRPWNKIGKFGKRINERPRRTPEYKEWKRIVIERDGHKCVLCGEDKNLQIDHIKSFALFPELRTNPSNGRTLCLRCHKRETKIFYIEIKSRSNKIAKNTNAA